MTQETQPRLKQVMAVISFPLKWAFPSVSFRSKSFVTASFSYDILKMASHMQFNVFCPLSFTVAQSLDCPMIFCLHLLERCWYFPTSDFIQFTLTELICQLSLMVGTHGRIHPHGVEGGRTTWICNTKCPGVQSDHITSLAPHHGCFSRVFVTVSCLHGSGKGNLEL